MCAWSNFFSQSNRNIQIINLKRILGKKFIGIPSLGSKSWQCWGLTVFWEAFFFVNKLRAPVVLVISFLKHAHWSLVLKEVDDLDQESEKTFLKNFLCELFLWKEFLEKYGWSLEKVISIRNKVPMFLRE